MNYQQLYSRLTVELSARLHNASKPQVHNQALVTLALAYSPNCHLATLATLLPAPGQRENLVQRIRRWLDNQAVTQYRCYMPLVRHLFAHWSGVELGPVMDRTDIEHRWSLLMLAAAFRHRALPLAWRLLPFGATNAETQIALLEQVQPCYMVRKRSGVIARHSLASTRSRHLRNLAKSSTFKTLSPGSSSITSSNCSA